MQNNNNVLNKSCQYGILYKSDIIPLKSSTASELLVYMVYLVHASKDSGRSFPSYTTITSLTGLSRSSVIRAVKGLKTKNILQEVGKTTAGVNIFKIIRGITDGTSVTDDTRVTDDTSVTDDTTPSVTGDTTPVSQVTPITSYRTDKNNNCFKLANTKDEKLFSLLWEKWSQSPLCLWEALNPLQEYQLLRDRVLNLWKTKNYQKDLLYELQIVDIYLMQSKDNITQGKEYSSAPRLWAKNKWSSGIEKWLSSSTPSYLSSERKAYISKCIHLEVIEQDYEKPVEPVPSMSGQNEKYHQELEAMYELLYDCEDLRTSDGFDAMVQLFKANQENTPFPDSLRNDTRFYEYFHIIDNHIGADDE